MDLADIIPINPIAEVLNIPEEYRWLLLFLILIIGYISLKYLKKNYKYNIN